MRTTIRLDAALLDELKARAQREKTSLAKLLDRVVRAGLRAGTPRASAPRFRQRTFALGTPRVAMDKALALSAALEDEEIVRELSLRK